MDKLKKAKAVTRRLQAGSAIEPATAAFWMAWLVAEVDRLRAEVAYMRDHPGWVPPIPPDNDPKQEPIELSAKALACLRDGQ